MHELDDLGATLDVLASRIYWNRCLLNMEKGDSLVVCFIMSLKYALFKLNNKICLPIYYLKP